MTYEVDSACSVTPEGWVDLAIWTGRSQRRLPLSIREADEALTHCDSIVAVVGPGCDPRSGGIAGTAHLAAVTGMPLLHFGERFLPRMPFVRWLGDVPVSNVGSVSAWTENYRAEVRWKWRRNLGIGEE